MPHSSVSQAERLKEEFNNLGVEISIVTDGYLRVLVENGKLKNEFEDIDFAIYLDKDKYFSQILERTGVRLFNSHDAIRVCDDKAETYIALADKGFNLPDTIFGALCYNKDAKISDSAIDAIGDRLGYPLIVKQCYGSLGKGVFKADNRSELKTIMEEVKTCPHLFQKYIDCKKGVDVRLIVIGGKCIATMERRNPNDYRSNVGCGGTGVVVELPEGFVETAERISRVLKLDYCGVDLLYGKDNQPIVCEVNSNAFFDGIESVTGINVAKAYAEYVIKTIDKKTT